MLNELDAKREALRIEALKRYNIVGTEPETSYDEIAKLASVIAGTPIALISFVADKVQWFKARVGLDLAESPRDIAFCSHAILSDQPLIVEDALLDERFKNNPFVTAPNGLRFYLGIPLIDKDGFAVGALAVADTKPRQLSSRAIKSISFLASQVVELLRLRAEVVSVTLEQQLLEAEKNLFLSLVSSLREVVFQIDSDLNWKFLSPSWSKLTGGDPKKSVGRNVLDDFHPEDRDLLRKKLLEAKVSNEEKLIRLRTQELNGKTRWVDATLIPQYSADRELKSINGTLSDVTEAVLASQAAAEKAEVMSSIFEAAPFMMGLVELRGDQVILLSANRVGQQAMGLKTLNRPLDVETLNVAKEKIEFWNQKYRESAALGRPVHFEYEQKIGDRIVWSRCSANRCSNNSNHFIFVAQDITEEKEKDELLEQQRLMMIQSGKLSAIGEMAAGIAHEINNPLAIIRATSEFFISEDLEAAVKSGALVEGLRRIETTTDRIAKIISGLRTFARDGTLDPAEPVMIQQALVETFDLCQRRFTHEGIALEVNLPKDPIVANIRPVPFSQAVLNLVINAFDAVKNSPKKVVSVSLTASATDLEIVVRDSGPGITPEIMEKIFNPFFSTKGAGKGMGLGLSISRSIVESHSGALTAQSVPGSTEFIIKLPVAASHLAVKKVS